MFWFWLLIIIGLILWAAFALHPAVGLLVLIGIVAFFWAGAKEHGLIQPYSPPRSTAAELEPDRSKKPNPVVNAIGWLPWVAIAFGFIAVLINGK